MKNDAIAVNGAQITLLSDYRSLLCCQRLGRNRAFESGE
jgi:hypothetical protein